MPSLGPWLLPSGASVVSRAMLLVLGFLNIQHKRIVKDPDTPEAPTADKRSALPIVVSNHISWVDILLAGYLYRCESCHAPPPPPTNCFSFNALESSTNGQNSITSIATL